MPCLQPTFTEEFHVAQDDETLAVDLWAYLNARQANLGWEPKEDRLWRHIDDLLQDLRPALEGGQGFGESLRALARHWSQEEANAGDANAEQLELRRELGEMLQRSLDRRLG